MKFSTVEKFLTIEFGSNSRRGQVCVAPVEEEEEGK
jgi:hypothetical protein